MLNQIKTHTIKLRKDVIALTKDVADTKLGEIRIGTVIHLGLAYWTVASIVEIVKVLREDFDI